MSTDDSVLEGTVFEDDSELTLGQLCQHCGIHAETIETLVAEGILVPRGQGPSVWCFSYRSVRMVRRVVRIQRDLGVNLAGAALAVDLLERIEALEARVQRLKSTPRA